NCTPKNVENFNENSNDKEDIPPYLTVLFNGKSFVGNKDLLKYRYKSTLYSAAMLKEYCNAKEKINGRTALHASSQKGHSDLVELLLKYGADAISKDKFGHTCLHFAARSGKNNIVEI